MIIYKSLKEAVKQSLINYVAYYQDNEGKMYVFLNGQLKVKFV